MYFKTKKNSSLHEITSTSLQPTLNVSSRPMQIDYNYSPQYVVASNSTEENNTKLSRKISSSPCNKERAFHQSEVDQSIKMDAYISYPVFENSTEYQHKNDGGKNNSYSELPKASTASLLPSRQECHHDNVDKEGQPFGIETPINGDKIPNGDDKSLDGDEFDMSEEHLLKFSVRDLNKILHGLPKNKQKILKQKRRTLKNRGYAQNCRSKRMVARQDLEVTNTTLHRNMQGMINELEKVKKECEMLKEILQKERLEKNNLEDIVRSFRGN